MNLGYCFRVSIILCCMDCGRNTHVNLYFLSGESAQNNMNTGTFLDLHGMIDNGFKGCARKDMYCHNICMHNSFVSNELLDNV